MRNTERVVQFRKTESALFPYEAEVDGARWTLRLNDFPAEPLYTLLVDGAPVEDLDTWPRAWKRPT